MVQYGGSQQQNHDLFSLQFKVQQKGQGSGGVNYADGFDRALMTKQNVRHQEL